MSRHEPAVGSRFKRMGKVLLFALSLLLLLSLLQYFAQDMGFLTNVEGELPRVGTATYGAADLLVRSLGIFCFAIPVCFLLWGWAAARGWNRPRVMHATFVLTGAALVGAAGSHLLPIGESSRFLLGGAAGGYLAARLAVLFGVWGAVLVLLTAGVLFILSSAGLRGIHFLRGCRPLAEGAVVFAGIGANAVGNALKTGVRRGVNVAGTGAERLLRSIGERTLTGGRDEEDEYDGMQAALEGTAAGRGRAPRPGAEGYAEVEDDAEGDLLLQALGGGKRERANGGGAPRNPRIISPAAEPQTAEADDPREPVQLALSTASETAAPLVPRNGRAAARGGEASARPRRAPSSGEAFSLPDEDLLERGDLVRSVSKDELLSRSEALEGRLKDFGAEGRVVEVHPGPVITRFEIEPARGVKVSQIANLANDLALGLRARSLRLLAPIPGRGTVGVEIPNEHPATVRLREVLAHDVFRSSKHALPIAIGKDISGRPRVAGLESMPHLLIAGSTGSGKSVCINAILVSFLYSRTPEDVRLLLIDPKRLELGPYNGIPHLLNPVVTDAKSAVRILRWAVTQMEWRYKLLAQAGVRDIAHYNVRVGQRNREIAAGREGREWERLPYMVILVDELADLMLSAPGEIEDALAKLAQMARAVGIHLVLATQRPSVDVITGVIKANFPSRIAFKVPSKTDSRTILDANGAESLLGRGDMLFLEAGRPEPERMHGCFVSSAEVERIADFWRDQSSVDPEQISFSEQDMAGEANSDDELFREAARLVITHQQGSASLLQRRLKVGYSRASRLVDMLEAAGVVGPSEGSKAREVLVDASYLQTLDP